MKFTSYRNFLLLNRHYTMNTRKHLRFKFEIKNLNKINDTSIPKLTELKHHRKCTNSNCPNYCLKNCPTPRSQRSHIQERPHLSIECMWSRHGGFRQQNRVTGHATTLALRDINRCSGQQSQDNFLDPRSSVFNYIASSKIALQILCQY